MDSIPTPPATPPVDASPKPEIYILQRNHQAAARLNVQHDIWRKELGFNLHPSIPLPEPSLAPYFKSNDFRVADIATGTGIWLLEQATANPHIEFHGFDINTSQAPPSAWLPPNITLHEWDMTSPSGPLPDHICKYDIIHLRLVVLAVEDNITPLITNLLSMLKPGGYLQWDEFNFNDPMLRHAQELQGYSAGLAITKIHEMMTERSHSDWFLRLPEVLEQHGLEQCGRFGYRPRLENLKYATDLIVMVWEEVVNRLDDGDERKLMLAKLVEETKMDVMGGSGLAHGKSVTVARKPLC